MLDEDLFEEEEDTIEDMYLTFQVGQEEYGLEVIHVVEIVGIRKITEVPDMPAFVKGVINLRGQVIPVIDIRTRFHMEPREYTERTSVIVTTVGDTMVGLVVDKVLEVIEIPEKEIAPPPELSSGSSNRFIKGLARTEQVVRILLETSQLLFEGEMRHAAAVSTSADVLS